jgi:cohesin loading factor subunit SCC2
VTVVKVFSHRESYRGLIIEEIFTSLSKLSAAKRNLRRYRLSEDKAIQMVAALIMQLVQSVVIIPDSVPNSSILTSHLQNDTSVDARMVVVTSYDAAVKIAQNFLSTLVTKCGSKGDEVDYRPLLEYFISDLLTALNMPEWPAAELMLTVLGRILVNTFASDSCDVSLKHTALEHVGTVAASLRRDAVFGNDHDKALLLKALDKLNGDAVQGTVPTSPDELPESDLRLLQRGLLEYLMLRTRGDANFQVHILT